MKFSDLSVRRIAEAAVPCAILVTALAAFRSHAYNASSIVPMLVGQGIFYFLISAVAAFVARAAGSLGQQVQAFVFFCIVALPSIGFTYHFYKAMQFYEYGRVVLVLDHKLTAAGYQSFALDTGTYLLAGVVATLVYFRGFRGMKSEP